MPQYLIPIGVEMRVAPCSCSPSAGARPGGHSRKVALRARRNRSETVDAHPR